MKPALHAAAQTYTWVFFVCVAGVRLTMLSMQFGVVSRHLVLRQLDTYLNPTYGTLVALAYALVLLWGAEWQTALVLTTLGLQWYALVSLPLEPVYSNTWSALIAAWISLGFVQCIDWTFVGDWLDWHRTELPDAALDPDDHISEVAMVDSISLY
ncbi:hypothetical protein HDU91_004019 [Kappamyces sp. JEL0680]|nr:hypothetical protein HDU91_004019 [Kappamyces sp. JEL0680]